MMSYDQGRDTGPFFTDFEKGLYSFHHRRIGVEEKNVKSICNLGLDSLFL